MFCLACVLFPVSSHRVVKQVISEPYKDRKDLLEYIKNQTFTEYHLNSMARLNEFIGTMNKPEKGIGVTISGKEKKTLKKIEAF